MIELEIYDERVTLKGRTVSCADTELESMLQAVLSTSDLIVSRYYPTVAEEEQAVADAFVRRYEGVQLTWPVPEPRVPSQPGAIF